MPSEFELGNSNLDEEELSAAASDTKSVVCTPDILLGGHSNSRDSLVKSNIISPSNVVYRATKIIEFAQIRPKPNVIPNSKRNIPMSLKISSVASGDGVALMTNGFNVDSKTDEDTKMQPQISDVQSLAGLEYNVSNNAPKIEASNKNHPNDASDANSISNSKFLDVNPKIESIDISDDEQQKSLKIPPEMKLTVKKPSNHTTEYPMKGYIYCLSNIQLGRVKVEWTSPNHIKIYLSASNDTVDIECDETDSWQTNVSAISMYMHKYIRKRFYGVYPAHLKLEWIFLKIDYEMDKEPSRLCDLISVETNSVRRYLIDLNLWEKRKKI